MKEVHVTKMSQFFEMGNSARRLVLTEGKNRAGYHLSALGSKKGMSNAKLQDTALFAQLGIMWDDWKCVCDTVRLHRFLDLDGDFKRRKDQDFLAQCDKIKLRKIVLRKLPIEHVYWESILTLEKAIREMLVSGRPDLKVLGKIHFQYLKASDPSLVPSDPADQEALQLNLVKKGLLEGLAHAGLKPSVELQGLAVVEFLRPHQDGALELELLGGTEAPEHAMWASEDLTNLAQDLINICTAQESCQGLWPGQALVSRALSTSLVSIEQLHPDVWELLCSHARVGYVLLQRSKQAQRALEESQKERENSDTFGQAQHILDALVQKVRGVCMAQAALDSINNCHS